MKYIASYLFTSPYRNSGTLPQSLALVTTEHEIPELCLKTTASEHGSLSAGALLPKRTCSWGDAELAFRVARKQKGKKKAGGGGDSAFFGGRGSFAETGCRPTTRDRRGRHEPSGRVRKAPLDVRMAVTPSCHVHHP
ncbi:hypothetical protein CEXT_812461 [Caerostris extrusa]|uniref:Uncharacterized protein n=1 Tax=Caerostris extrusa TaxID=172846 RepID=A0AAV4VZU7_CAEEX|nr:hypothetical protein CEXT_812461 [Caerostris extrusa]